MEMLEQMWHNLHILDLRIANLCNLDKDDLGYNSLHEHLMESRLELINQFNEMIGYNPDNLCRTARKKEIERGDIVWCTHHNEWVYVLDDEEGPAKQLLCMFDNGATQSIPLCYLKSNGQLDLSKKAKYVK